MPEYFTVNVCRIAAVEGISFFLVWDFCVNSHFSYTTAIESKFSVLLTIVQERRFASGFSQNILWTHSF